MRRGKRARSERKEGIGIFQRSSIDTDKNHLIVSINGRERVSRGWVAIVPAQSTRDAK